MEAFEASKVFDTIAAQATPLGNGGLGVIRISGPAAGQVLAALFKSQTQPQSRPRELILGSLADQEGRLLDQALAVWFPGPRSYTGEDVAELHCHGSARLLREALLLAVGAGARLAERGEFTQRAFLNGQLDLAQAEAVLALIQARSGDSLRLAAAQLAGGLSQKLRDFSGQLNQILAQIAVAVDFPDDADAPDQQRLLAALAPVRQGLGQLLEQARRGSWLREGRMIAIAGPANAGKSSLFNALLQRERAIVTPEPGATRDALEDHWELAGLPLSLWDTAGFREEAAQEAERLGMARSRQAMAEAALLLLVLDSTAPSLEPLNPLLAESRDKQRLLLINKTDIAEKSQLEAAMIWLEAAAPGEKPLLISAKTGQGLPELRQAIRQILLGGSGEETPPLLSEARHQQAVSGADQALEQAARLLAEGWPVDLAAIDIENALASLSLVTGDNVSDALITEIFSRFCVGK